MGIIKKNRDALLYEFVFLLNPYDLYSLPNIIRVINSRRMRWMGHMVRMGDRRGSYRVLVGRPEEKRSPGRPRRRWDDNMKLDLRKVG
jgi:hypothetical protein